MVYYEEVDDMSNTNTGIHVYSYKDGNNINEANSRNYIERFLKPKLSVSRIVSRSIEELQSIFGISNPNAVCELVGEYGMNAKLEYNDNCCLCSFWYDNNN